MSIKGSVYPSAQVLHNALLTLMKRPSLATRAIPIDAYSNAFANKSILNSPRMSDQVWTIIDVGAILFGQTHGYAQAPKC